MTTPRPTVQQTAQLLDLLEKVPTTEEVRDPQVLRDHLAQVCEEQGIVTTPARLDQAVKDYLASLPVLSPEARSRIARQGLLWWPRPRTAAEQRQVIRTHRTLQNASGACLPERLARDLFVSLLGWMGFGVVLFLLGKPGMGAMGSINFLFGALLARQALWWGSATRLLRWSLKPGRAQFENKWLVSLESGHAGGGFEPNADRMWAPCTPTADQLSRWSTHPALRATLHELREGSCPFTHRDAYFMDQLQTHPESWTDIIESKQATAHMLNQLNTRRGRSCK